MKAKLFVIFAGSGTALKVALELGSNAVEYRINPEFVQVIRDKVRVLNEVDIGGLA